jgi:hypothetical protein
MIKSLTKGTTQNPSGYGCTTKHNQSTSDFCPPCILGQPALQPLAACNRMQCSMLAYASTILPVYNGTNPRNRHHQYVLQYALVSSQWPLWHVAPQYQAVRHLLHCSSAPSCRCQSEVAPHLAHVPARCSMPTVAAALAAASPLLAARITCQLLDGATWL